MGPFENNIKDVSSTWTRQANYDVGDTMYLGLKWFEQYTDITPTASDLLSFAEIVLRREEHLISEKSE